MTTEHDWFKTHIRQVHMDFHMPEFPAEAITGFDAKEFVGHLRRGRVNVVALFAKCHFGNGFYNTQVGHKHAGLPGDFLREAAEECRKHDIRTLAYYSLCCDRRAWENYPHWRAIQANGEPFPIVGPWGRVCVNTPYREELVLPQIEEIAADYPVDGFFIDIPMVPDCHCPYCKRKYQAMYGRDYGENIPARERQAFLYGSTTRFLREMRALCNRHNPQLKIVTNQGGRIDAPLTFRQANDYGVWESQPHSNYLSHSFATRAVRTHDRPTQVMSVRFYQGWGDLTLKPTAQMTTEFAAMIGNGGVASSGDQVNVDGTLQPPVYDMFDQAFGFVEKREDILRGAKAVSHAALVAPVPRADWPAPAASGNEMKGAHKALVESHVQFDIITSLDVEQFANYECLVLTEPCDFAPDVFEKLRAWVANGGTLIAVGKSLMPGDNRFELQDVFGLEYLEPSVFRVSHFLPRPEVRGEANELPLQCRGPAIKVMPTTATVLADYIYPQIEGTSTYAFRHGTCPPPAMQPSPYPFATVNDFGQGRAVYVAGSVFGIYWQTNHHWLRQFVAGIWDYLFPEPAYRIDMNGLVEANLMRAADGALLLNLIHYQVGHQGDKGAIPSIEKVYPIRDVACQVRATGVRSVRVEPEGEELPFAAANGYIAFTVPSIHYLAIVRIETD